MPRLDDDFGAELRRRRLAAGMSLRELAEVIHYSRGHLCKVENGRAPSQQLASICDAALQAGGELIAMNAPARVRLPALSGDLDSRWLMEMGPGAESSFAPIGRRDALATTGASMIGLAFSAHARVSAVQANSAIDTFRTWFQQIRHLGQAAEPAIVLPTLIAQTHTLRGMATAARGSARRDLLVLAARYAEYTGWMAQEAGNDGAALWWTDQSVSLATAGGDSTLGAYALVRRALITLYRHDPAQTVDLARQARAGRNASSRVQGLAALREAQGIALAGEHDACMRALDHARRHLSRAEPPSPASPVLGTSALPDPVTMAAGWCLFDLGRPGEAAEVLAAEISRIPAAARRARTRYAARRALAYAAAGEVDHACDLTRKLLPDVRDLASATINTDLYRLTHTLNRWHSHGSVRDLLPDLNAARRLPQL